MTAYCSQWRRGCGCVTLAISIGCLVVWMRSKYTYDTAEIVMSQRQYKLQSFHDECILWSWEARGDEGVVGWNTWTDPDSLFISIFVDAKRRQLNEQKRRFHEWVIPYWVPTIATGLSSALLLLSKTRKERRAPMNPSYQEENKGGETL